MWKPIIQYFIYSRLHRLCSGTEYHISSLLLLSQSSLYYAVLNLFLISIFYNSYYISLHFCTPNFYFFWIKKKDNQRLGQIPFLKRQEVHRCNDLMRMGKTSLSLLGYRSKWRNIPQFLHTTTSFCQKQTRLLFDVTLTSAGTRILKEGAPQEGSMGLLRLPRAGNSNAHAETPQTSYKSQLWLPVTESSKEQGFMFEIPRFGTHSLWLGVSDDFINTNNFVNQTMPFLFHLEFWTGITLQNISILNI